MPSTEYAQEIDEFVVAARGRTSDDPIEGFGGIYCIVVIDVTPKAYRVLMSLPKPLTDAQVRAAATAKGKTDRAYPYDVIKARDPNLGAFRYIGTDWLDYKNRNTKIPTDAGK